MNLKSLKTIVTSRAGRQVLKLQKHSPVLLFGAGVVGMITTVVLASKATLRLEDELYKINNDKELARSFHKGDPEAYDTRDFQKDMTLLYIRSAVKVVKLYGPAIIVGTVSVAALTGSHFILNARNAGLTAAYAAIDKGYQQYRERVIAELGAGKDEEFQYGIETTEITEQTAEGKKAVRKAKAIMNAGDKLSPYAVIFDESNKNWNRETQHNQFFIQCQQNYAQDLFRGRGHLFLNEVYDMLGMPRTKAGQIVGWVAGFGDDFVDFGVFRGDTFMGQQFANGDEKSVILDFNVAGPVYDKI